MARKRRTDKQAMRPPGWVARWLKGMEAAYAAGRIGAATLVGARKEAARLRGPRGAAAQGSGDHRRRTRRTTGRRS